MDKTAIRNFAIEARKILMKSAIAEAGFYGISKDGVKAPIQKGKDFEVYETLAGTEKRIFGDDIKRRENLANAVKELGFEQVIEETAYTWFNRIIAIRFMEVNNYLPTRVRVLSSETGSSTPDIVTQADTVELNMSVAELESIQQSKQDNKYDEAFRLLFIKQCNELNAILPGLFEKTNDYMELLLKISYTGDGVIRMLVDTIPEDNFNVETEGQVEIIGWMYQYYNTELKDDTFAKLKKNVKITKERIPAATQLFTPDWIVRYMVENSLGRVWIEHLRAVDPSVDEKSKAEEFGWKYYLPEAEQEENVAAQLVDIRASYKRLTPQDITCIDPCMGSGHILVYMFDVLMDIYRSEGFSEREAVFDILEKNIRGLDIDRRAYQLSYFALMMKARGYNRIFFRGHENLDGERVQAVPQVYAIEESNSVNRDQLKYFGSNMSEIERNSATNEIIGLLDQLKDAKEYGSILEVNQCDWKLLNTFISQYDFSGQMSFEMVGLDRLQQILMKLVRVAQILYEKNYVCITNPPYMGYSGMNEKLAGFVTKNYTNSKADLFAIFIERCIKWQKKAGYLGMITQHAWMFLTGFADLRNAIYDSEVVNMAHLGPHAFEEIGGEVVQTTSFILRKIKISDYCGVYVRLVDESSQQKKEQAFLAGENIHFARLENCKKIPGMPLGYWISDDIFKVYENVSLSSVSKPCKGIDTGENNRFLRLWYEVDFRKVMRPKTVPLDDKDFSEHKWYPYNKGGTYRKWYGNNDYVINWGSDGSELRNFKKSNLRNKDYYFRNGITWSTISSGGLSVRYFDYGYLFDNGGCCLFASQHLKYILSLLNSQIVDKLMDLSPTINSQPGDIGRIPFILDMEREERVVELADRCIQIERDDWDSSETSWDFEEHPLLRYGFGSVECHVKSYLEELKKRKELLADTENEINSLLKEIYHLENEEYKASRQTLIHQDEKSIIVSLLSYAVGCMFGRYSLDEKGIVYAGGEWDLTRYKKYIPDVDGIIPITDSKYFKDDIVELFLSWIGAAFGDEDKDINISYIASILSNKADSPLEAIRQYFLNDFFANHCEQYSVSGSGKRPIYWMFSSGKNNAFKCLIYVHRYHKDLVGLIRSDYLTVVQNAIDTALSNEEFAILNSTSEVDKAKSVRMKEKYIKQLSDIKAYYQALSHIALMRIELDTDAGIKANYARFQGVELVSEGSKKNTIDLLEIIR